MRKRTRLIGILAVLGGLAVAAGAAVAPAASTGTASTRTLRLLDITQTEANIDLGRSGPSAGDEHIFNDVLKNPAGTKRLGTVHGVCTITALSKTGGVSQCVASFQLPGGTIEIAGAEDFGAPRFTAAITGGTGRYHTTSGQLIHTLASGERPTHDTFQLISGQ